MKVYDNVGIVAVRCDTCGLQYPALRSGGKPRVWVHSKTGLPMGWRRDELGSPGPEARHTCSACGAGRQDDTPPTGEL